MAENKENPQLSALPVPLSSPSKVSHKTTWCRTFPWFPWVWSSRFKVVIAMVAIPGLLATSKLLTILPVIGPPTGPLTSAVSEFRHLNDHGLKTPTKTLPDPEWKPQDFKHQDFETVTGPVLPVASNFADPAYIEVAGVQYAFATNNRGQEPPIKVQVAQSLDQGKTWNLLMDGGKQHDAMPQAGAWSTGNRVWAPDVVQLNETSFILYYTAEVRDHPHWHCVGIATASSVLGPYTPQPSYFSCPIGKALGGDTAKNEGGAIDPDGFFDKDSNKRYVVYKVDGNGMGHGGNCGNWPLNGEPVIPTPIMLQEVDVKDGITKIGSPVQILDRDEHDGPLIEAPSLYKANGVYFLFFSSNCFAGPLYDTSYATSRLISGPYVKTGRPLFVTGDGPHLMAPGGPDISADGETLVFHGSMKNQYTNNGNGVWEGDLNHRRRRGKPEPDPDTDSGVVNGKPSNRDGDPENSDPDKPKSPKRPGLIRSMYVAKPKFDGETVHV